MNFDEVTKISEANNGLEIIVTIAVITGINLSHYTLKSLVSTVRYFKAYFFNLIAVKLNHSCNSKYCSGIFDQN